MMVNKLYYRIVGQDEFQSILMTGEKLYSAEIPAKTVTSLDIEYYIFASDGEHSSRVPNEGYFLIKVEK